MKKITINVFVIMFMLSSFIGFAQTLNQNAGWPNGAWSVTGTYNADPTAFEADPTVTTNFAFDDDDAGNGNDDDIAAESPVIDLTAAHGAGETWLTVTADYVYYYLANDELVFQYWDADGATWVNWGDNFDTLGTTTSTFDDFCSGTPSTFTSVVLNIVSFTPTQLSGFRYRISYNDDPAGADWNYGFCFQSPTITSATPPACPDPSALTASNIDGFSADLAWTENGSATAWDIEVVDITGGGSATGTPTASGVMNPYTVMGLTPSNDYEFYVLADCGGSTSTWVGPFAFSTTVACPDPTALTATNITTTTADLGWTAGASEAMWDVELGAQGFTATGTPTAAGVANPYNATGLTANTAYDFYVRADCNPNGTSNWVGPFTFTTACTAFAAPYTEDFETFTTGGAAFGTENCWSGTGGSYYWESAPGTDAGSGGTGPDSSITTGNYFYTEASAGTSGDITDLLSPLVDLTALTAPALTFNYHMFGGQIGTLDVLVNGTDNVWSLSGEQQTSATQAWELAVVDLAAYAGQTISVTFRATSAGTFEGDISIDNVSFTELPSCPTPNALTATTITDTSADLGWTENGSATAWDIEIVDVTGGGSATGTPTASGVANPYAAMGLTENNDYQFYVRADCGSAWAGPFSFTTLETCPAPSGLGASNIMETSADLDWTENGSAAAWNIELVDVTGGGSATGTPTATGVANPYSATGLASSNDYEYYVQADCGGDVSAWVGPFAFTTPGPPPANDLFANAIAISCGSTVMGTTLNATQDEATAPDTATVETDTAADNDSPWVWYSFTGGGVAERVTLSTCGVANTDFDTEIFVYTGTSGSLTLIDDGYDECGGSAENYAAETSFDSDGTTTYYVAVGGYNVGSVGNFQLSVTCATLSLNDVENPASFSYYPNPVQNTLKLNAQSTIENVTMYNMLGQEVLKATPNNVDSELDMSNLQDGTYFVKVTIANITKTIRVIKQ